MTARRKLMTLIIALIIVALFVIGPTAAFAHHNGQNPEIGALNEEMVHSGLTERAADPVNPELNWDSVDPPENPGLRPQQ